MSKSFQPKIIVILFFCAFISFNSAMSQIGTWTQKSNFAGFARARAISFSIGTKGYIGTGRGENNMDAIDFWEYDPQNDTWTQKADLGNTGRIGGTGFSIGNKGYAGIGASNGQPKSDIWEYNPQNNTWVQKAFYPGIGKSNAVSFNIGNFGYVGTGSPSGTIGNETKDFWEYNPANNSWSQKTDFGGIQRNRAIGFSIGTKGYIGTGYHFDGTRPISFNDFWEYDPQNNTWTEKASVQELERNNGVGFSTDSKGYIGMGYNYKTDFWQYDPNTNSWLQVLSFSGEGRLFASSFSIGNKGYIGMGYSVGTNGTILYNDLWEYEEQPLSLLEIELQNKLKVYPNPTTNIINISTDLNIIEIIVFDSQGKEQLKTTKHTGINISSFSSGTYYLNIKTATGETVKKIIKN
jgi:N-acetylneuraminic acid mutarotase